MMTFHYNCFDSSEIPQEHSAFLFLSSLEPCLRIGRQPLKSVGRATRIRPHEKPGTGRCPEVGDRQAATELRNGRDDKWLTWQGIFGFSIRSLRDDLVNKRTKTVATMAERFLKLKTYEDYFQVAEDIAHSLESEGFRVPDNRALEVEEAIGAESSAFDREGQDLQILTCLMLAALKATKDAQPTATGWSRPEIIAVSIWLSLGTQNPLAEPKLEALRRKVGRRHKSLINRSADASRSRSAIATPL